MSSAVKVGLAIALACAVSIGRVPVASAAPAKTTTTTTSTTIAPTTTTSDVPPPNLPTAPPGFADSVVNVYQSAFSAAQALGQGAALTPVSDYQQQVAAMGPDALDALYAATRTQPEWTQIPALMQAIAADAAGGASVTGAAKGAARPADSVGPIVPTNCSSGPPDSAVFAALIVIDVSQAVFNVSISEASVYVEIPLLNLVGKYFGIAAAIAAVVIGVAQIVHDSLVYVGKAGEDCEADNQNSYLANIESTTTQLYSLLNTTVSASVTGLQSTLADTQDSVQQISVSVDALKGDLRQALTTSTDLKTAIGGDTQAIATQIDSDQAGLRANLDALDALETANQQKVAAKISGETAAVQASVASSTQLELEEIDSAAATLTQQITSIIDQAVASAHATRATIQSEYEAGLRLRIEQALAADVPQVQFRLPLAAGGLLDALPVGVQSVVAGDVADVARLGIPIAKEIRRLMKLAASDLAAQRYDAAFADLRHAYLDLDRG